MARFTLDELRELMRTCGGPGDGVDLDADIADTGFEALGYDSLALMEMASRIQRGFGVEIPEDVLIDMETPREMLSFVDDRLGAA